MPSSPWPFLAGEAELGAQTCPDPPDPGSAARAVPWPPSPPWACPAPRVCGIHRKAQQAGEGQRAALPGLLLRERRAGRDKNISGKSESPWRSVGWERWERCPGESSDSSSLSRHSRAASALPGQGGSQGRLFLCGASRAAVNSRPQGHCCPPPGAAGPPLFPVGNVPVPAPCPHARLGPFPGGGNASLGLPTPSQLQRMGQEKVWEAQRRACHPLAGAGSSVTRGGWHGLTAPTHGHIGTSCV